MWLKAAVVPRAPISQSLVTAPISHPLQIMSLQQKHSDIVAAEAEADSEARGGSPCYQVPSHRHLYLPVRLQVQQLSPPLAA